MVLKIYRPSLEIGRIMRFAVSFIHARGTDQPRTID